MEDAIKWCASCGRSFTWRKKWEGCWEQVRYCSARCRTHKPGAPDRALEEAITSGLSERARGAITPLAELIEEDERGVCAARRLAVRGEVEFVQGGRSIDWSTAKKPIMLRRP